MEKDLQKLYNQKLNEFENDSGADNDFINQDEDGMIMGYGQGNSGMHQNFGKMSGQVMSRTTNLLGGLNGDYGDGEEVEDDNMDEGEENLGYE